MVTPVLAAQAAGRNVAPAQYVGSLLVGLVCAAVAVLVWRGTWRSWPGGPTGAGPAFVFPAAALFALGYALYGLLGPARTTSFVVGYGFWIPAVVVIVLGVWDPAWFGPRYYREYKRGGRRATTRGAVVTATMTGARPGDEQNSEALVRRAHHPEKPLGRRHAALIDPGLGRPTDMHTEGVAAGNLLLYRHEIVFAAQASDDALRPGPTVRTIPVGTVTGVRVTPTDRTRAVQVRFPTVEIHTTGDEPYRFECARAQTVADDLVRHYDLHRLRS